MEQATFGAGCFWQVEAAFRRLRGVKKTLVGYAGGVTENPTYEDVCTDMTGHAEVVQVDFDPELVSYRELLEVFWSNHDPTQLNRQGPDVGSQYRSVIFTHGLEQAAVARASAEEQQRVTGKGIVTEIKPTPEFHPAEDYHQQYLEKRGLTSCAVGVERVGL